MRSAKIEGFEYYTIYENGDIWSDYKKGLLKPSLNNMGYYKVNLYKDGKVYYKKIHRLLAIAFIPNPENKLEIDHIDRVRTNNNLSNLRWVTHKENMNNKDIGKGCICINKQKKGDKVYEYIHFHWCVNGKQKAKYFKTMKDAKKFQLLSFCFRSWKELL